MYTNTSPNADPTAVSQSAATHSQSTGELTYASTESEHPPWQQPATTFLASQSPSTLSMLYSSTLSADERLSVEALEELVRRVDPILSPISVTPADPTDSGTSSLPVPASAAADYVAYPIRPDGVIVPASQSDGYPASQDVSNSWVSIHLRLRPCLKY